MKNVSKATKNSISVGSAAPFLMLLLMFSTSAKAQVTADFSATPVSGCGPLVVSFTDLSNGPVTSWNWNFGNGNTSTLEDPAAVYVTPGLYDVSLMVGDGGTATDTLTQPGFIDVIGSNPTVNFASDVSSGTAPLAVQFTDQTSAAAAIVSWSWDFGDGNGSVSQNPAHVYADAGIYNASLTVVQTDGCMATNSAIIHVNPTGSMASFQVGSLAPGETRTITFDVVVSDDVELPPNKFTLVNQALVVTSSGSVPSDDIDDLGGPGAENATATTLVPGIAVSPGNPTVNEQVGSQTVTVALNAAPTDVVTFPVIGNSDGQCSVSPSSASLNSSNWNTGFDLTVSGIDDDIAEGSHTCTIEMAPTTSADAAFDGVGPRDINVNIIDDDTAGISVSPTSGLNTSEAGGMDTFDVVLESQPLFDVDIGLSSSDSTEGTISTTTLTFTAANWNVPQTATVTGLDDDIDDGDVAFTLVTDPATSTDPAYSGLNAADVSVTNSDNDTSQVTVNPGSGLVTTEAGGADSFTVVLDSEPLFDVSIPLATSDSTEGQPSPVSLIFTPANWNVPQTVTVTGQDDDVDDGDIAYTLVTEPAISTDAGYSGLNAADVSLSNVDDDTSQIVVSPTGGLVTTEAGGTDSFSVVLDSEPLSDVSIQLATSDSTEGLPSPTNLTFTASNWNVPQTVDVTGQDDAILDGDVAYEIVTNPAVSADPGYDGRDASDVMVANSDDDASGITINDVSILEGTASNQTLVFTVTLDNAVADTFTVDYSSSDGSAMAPADYQVALGMLTFAGLAGETQTIDVTIIGDDVPEADESFAISLGTPSNAAVAVNDGEGQAVIIDDDAADLAVNLTATPDPVVAGTEITYLATVSNIGPAVAADAVLTLELPDGVSVVSSARGGTPCSGTQVVVCTLGPIAANDSEQITVVAEVAPDVITPVTGMATVTSSLDLDLSNNTSSHTAVVQSLADLSLVMTIDPAGPAQRTFDLIATASNAGPSDAMELSISINLPEGVAVANLFATDGGACNTTISGNTQLTCAFPDSTGPGTIRTVSGSLSVLSSRTFFVEASVSSMSTDPVANNNDAVLGFRGAVIPIPALSWPMLLLMALLMIGATRWLRPRVG